MCWCPCVRVCVVCAVVLQSVLSQVVFFAVILLLPLSSVFYFLLSLSFSLSLSTSLSLPSQVVVSDDSLSGRQQPFLYTCTSSALDQGVYHPPSSHLYDLTKAEC